MPTKKEQESAHTIQREQDIEWYNQRREEYLDRSDEERAQRSKQALVKAKMDSSTDHQYGQNHKIEDLHNLQGLPAIGDHIWLYRNSGFSNKKAIWKRATFKMALLSPWRIVGHTDYYYKILPADPSHNTGVILIHKVGDRPHSTYHWKKVQEGQTIKPIH